MNSSFIGFITAITSVLAWGSYFVPMKRIKEYDPFYFQLIMATAILISSFFIALVFRSLTFSIVPMVSGILWSTGNIFSVLAVKKSGLSKTVPVWTGTGIFIAFLWGTLFFKERLSFLPISFAGIVLLIIGIGLISQVGEVRKTASRRGLLFAVIAGTLFGSYLVPLKNSPQPLQFLFPMSLGIMLGGIIIFVLKRPKVNFAILPSGVLSGIAWNIGNFASFFAVLNLGMSIGFPLTQMALLVSVLWGLLYFREIAGRKNVIKIVVASLVLFLGAILLSISK